MTKTLKLKITHKISQSANELENEASDANIHKDGPSQSNFPIYETSNIYSHEACNLDLLEACPSVHNNVLFSQQVSNHNELQSNSLNQSQQVSNLNDLYQSNSLNQSAQVSNHNDLHQSISPNQSAQKLDPPPVIIEIKKCNECQRQLDKCECEGSNKCTACFSQKCTCSKRCNACMKSLSKYSNFDILNKDYCICALESHMTIKKELQSQIEDEVSINEQSDIEKTLDERLRDFDIDLENPNFSAPDEEINISHITDQAVKIKLKSV